MNKLVVVFLLAILMVASISLVGCKSTSGDRNTTETGTTFPMIVIDDLGREVTIEEMPTKIVSLAPSNTEILYALGLEDKLVAVTEFCNYPEDALSKEKVGGYGDVDIEKIVVINPDLIVAEDMHKYEVIPMLEELGFCVVALVPHNLQEVMDSIELVGSITGTQAKAVQVVSDMQKRIQAITDITVGLDEQEKVKVLYVLWYEPIMSVGTDTRIHELIEKAGGINIAAVAGEGYPTLALEEVININPGVIIVDMDASLQFILNESRLAGVDAIVNGRVYSINPDLTNRPTPRIVEALGIMAEMIQPEIFGNAE